MGVEMERLLQELKEVSVSDHETIEWARLRMQHLKDSEDK